MADGSDTRFKLLAYSKASASKAGFADFKHVASTGSTNGDLVAEARKGVLSSCVLVADTQTAGRGRLGRHWRDSGTPASSLPIDSLNGSSSQDDSFNSGSSVSPLNCSGSPVGSSHSPAGSLLVSFRFPLLSETSAVTAAAIMVTVVAASAMSAVASVGVKVLSKWPNDLVVEYPHVAGKLAGILAEVVETQYHATNSDVINTATAVVPSTAVVVGLGLNLLPVSSEPGAVSLAEVGADVNRDHLLSCLLDFLPGFMSNPNRSLNVVKSASSTIGRMVRVKQTKGGVIVGRARDIDSQGRLTVDLNTGTMSVSASDVEHLRPA